MNDISSVSAGVQSLAQMANLKFTGVEMPISRSSTIFSPADTKDSLHWPCIILPTSRNPRFFGRSDELETIDRYLRESSVPGLRALAIYAMGGVGKTQTALAYAWSKTDEYDVICWLHAETEIALASSLGDAAHRLKLPQAIPGNNTSNALLVLDWLQQTGKDGPELSLMLHALIDLRKTKSGF